jgi:hypothetical protein
MKTTEKCICCGQTDEERLTVCVCGAVQCDDCGSHYDWRCCDARMDDAVDTAIELLELQLEEGQ